MSFITIFLISFLSLSCYACIPTQQLDYVTTSTTTTTTTTTSTTTTAPPTCPNSDWLMFDRGTYSWCMYIRWFTTSLYGSSALVQCQAINSAAVLSGFQNTEEVAKVLDIANNQGSDLQLFIGGYRTKACLHQMLTSTCNQLTSFGWTDNHTTGTDGFVWGPNEPDNVGLLQYYLVLYTGLGTMDDTAGLGNGAICGIQAGNF